MDENQAHVIEKQRIKLPEANPQTHALHRRTFLQQVTLPFALIIILSIGVVLLLNYFGVGTISQWSQIASIFLMMMWMLVSLLLLAVLVGLVYFVTQILKIMPPYTRLAQKALETIQTQVAKGAELSTKPFIHIQSFLAMVNAIFGRKSDAPERKSDGN